MRLPLLVLFLVVHSECCQSDGKYCSAALSASVLSGASLSYKCQFPIYIAKGDILRLDPTVYITMKIGEYCKKSCCSVTTSTSTSTTTTTTTTTTTPTPTTAPKSPLEKFNEVLNRDGTFKTLMNEIHFSASAKEGLTRYQKYSQVKEQVDTHNVYYELGMSTYKMATNQFSVALSDEVAPLTLSLNGLAPSNTLTSSSRKKRDATDSVDWRPYMKPILDQLTCGGCWAFSMVAMIEGFFAIRGVNTSSLSVQQLLTCDTATDPTYGVANVGCKGGYFQVAGTYLEVNAERDATDIPFDVDDTDCDSAMYSPVVPTILLFNDGYISGNRTTEQLTTMEQNIEDLVRKGPLSVGMAVSQDLYSYSSGVYDGDCGSTINHAVVIVGFTSDYWIIRNSWGSSWGENGYFRVQRTAGKDPCQLYSYWSQATEVGANETRTAVQASAGQHVVVGTSTTEAVDTDASGEKCDDCEEDCGCEYDDDDDDYNEEEEDPEETTTSTPKIVTKTTSTSTKATTTTTSKRHGRTTTTPKSFVNRVVDKWNNIWG